MSTYYGEVVTDEEVEDMFTKVFEAAEDAYGVYEAVGNITHEQLRRKLVELAAVREIALSQLNTFRGDEFKSLGPARELAKLKGYLGERKDNG